MQARATQSPRSSPPCRRTQSTHRCHRRMPALAEHSSLSSPHAGARRALVTVIAACRRAQRSRRGHRRMQARIALVCHRRMQALAKHSSLHVGTRKAVVAVIAACRRSQSIRRCHRRMSTHTKLSSRSSPHAGAHLQIGHCPAKLKVPLTPKTPRTADARARRACQSLISSITKHSITSPSLTSL